MTMIHLMGTVAQIVLALFTSSPVVAGVPGNADSENPSAEITITDVSAEWTHRSDAANTFRVSWKQTLTLRTAVPRLGMSPSRSSGEYRNATQQVSLSMDQLKLSYVVTTENGPGSDLPPYNKSTFDGTRSKDFVAMRSEINGQTGVGAIRAEPHAFAAESIQIRPLLLQYRPFFPKLGRPTLNGYSVEPERLQLGDVSCVILRKDEGESSTRLWLDPASQFLLLRETMSSGGVVRIQTDFRYSGSSNETHWMPTGWKIVTADKRGEMIESIEATVLTHSIGEEIPMAEFDIPFPAGTLIQESDVDGVRDFRAGGNPSEPIGQTR